MVFEGPRVDSLVQPDPHVHLSTGFGEDQTTPENLRHGPSCSHKSPWSLARCGPTLPLPGLIFLTSIL